MVDKQIAIDRTFNVIRKDDETHLLFIALFDTDVASLLGKRFSSTQTGSSHDKKENYDSIKEYCAPDVAVASAVASGINVNGNATKSLQLSLFDVSGSSAANRFVIALGVTDGNKKLTLDNLEVKIQIPLVIIIMNNRNNVGIYNESHTGMISKPKTHRNVQLQLLMIFMRVILEVGLSEINGNLITLIVAVQTFNKLFAEH